MIKNLEKSTVIKLKDQVPYLAGQVVSKTLAQNDSLSLTVFSFDKGEEISTHQSGGDAMVTVLEGTGRFTIDGEPHLVKEGETIVMPAKHPHAVYGEERFKMPFDGGLLKDRRSAHLERGGIELPLLQKGDATPHSSLSKRCLPPWRPAVTTRTSP